MTSISGVKFSWSTLYRAFRLVLQHDGRAVARPGGGLPAVFPHLGSGTVFGTDNGATRGCLASANQGSDTIIG